MTMAQERSFPEPSRADLQIVAKLSQVPEGRLKNTILEVVWALAGKVAPTREDE